MSYQAKLAAVRLAMVGLAPCSVWGADEPKAVATLEGRHDVHAIAFSPDGKTLATCSENTGVKLWSVQGLLKPKE
jgi:WD40 repeat protein